MSWYFQLLRYLVKYLSLYVTELGPESPEVTPAITENNTAPAPVKLLIYICVILVFIDAILFTSDACIFVRLT